MSLAIESVCYVTLDETDGGAGSVPRQVSGQAEDSPGPGRPLRWCVIW